MATWIVHLRIADRLLDCLEGIAQTQFVVGNIAPDSGLPNADWTAYTPDSRVSHFRINKDGEPKEINVQAFLDRYFSEGSGRPTTWRNTLSSWVTWSIC